MELKPHICHPRCCNREKLATELCCWKINEEVGNKGMMGYQDKILQEKIDEEAVTQ